VKLTIGDAGANKRLLKHLIRANTQITANPNDMKKNDEKADKILNINRGDEVFRILNSSLSIAGKAS